jgi:hypothetical protein
MEKRKSKFRIALSVLALAGVIFILEKTESHAYGQFSSATEKSSGNNSESACVLESEAQKYLDEIYGFSPNHFGVSKPKLMFNTKDNPHIGERIAVGKEDGKNITIFEKGFEELYGDTCSKASLARLQSTIAHEYAHHIDFNSGLIKKELKTKNLEYSAELGGEHALFELVWQKENPKAGKINTQWEKEEIEIIKKDLISI